MMDVWSGFLLSGPFGGSFSKVLLISAFLSWMITFVSRTLALQFGIVAKRNGRRRHERDTPLLGGLAFYLVLSGVVLSRVLFRNYISQPEVHVQSEFAFWVAITLMFGIGVLDDFLELKALPKFSVQIAAAVIVVFFQDTPLPIFDHLGIPLVLAIPLAVFCIVGITNAMNMIDGLDGLCSGLGAISALSLVAISLSSEGKATPTAIILFALAGCCVGFLFHNFNPAKIFLGDSGSLLIGFVLAVSAIQLNYGDSFFTSCAIPLLILGLPIVDVLFSIMRRVRMRRSVFQGDRSHIHHRLLQVGLSHRSVVLLLWICASYLGVTAYYLMQVPAQQSIFIYASVVPTLFFWFLALFINLIVVCSFCMFA